MHAAHMENVSSSSSTAVQGFSSNWLAWQPFSCLALPICFFSSSTPSSLQARTPLCIHESVCGHNAMMSATCAGAATEDVTQARTRGSKIVQNLKDKWATAKLLQAPDMPSS
jgi:hypothetical protein